MPGYASHSNSFGNWSHSCRAGWRREEPERGRPATEQRLDQRPRAAEGLLKNPAKRHPSSSPRPCWRVRSELVGVVDFGSAG